MRPVPAFEFPPAEEAALRKARRLAYWTLLYVSSAALFLYLTAGSSQAMRTSWLEDMVSLIPSIAFLVATSVATRKPRPHFPYGYHSAVGIGYLTAALALMAMGIYLLGEAIVTLVHQDRPTIGGFTLFGMTVWAGWPMLAALLYTSIPSYFFGRAKLKLAPKIHDKVLYADAEMMRADWMVEIATAVGVIGAGFGLWYLDGIAAAVISLDIVRDGAVNLRAAVGDLIDEMPKKTTEPSEHETVPDELRRHIEALPWVEKAEVRMREEGHVFFGEAFIVPRTTDNLLQRITELSDSAKALNWRIHDLVVMPVEWSALEEVQQPKQED